MVDGSDHSSHKCNDIGKLYRPGNKCERMPERTFKCNHGNGQCPAGNTDDNSLRSDDLLRRRKCYTDIECRDELFMVKWSDHTNNKCNFNRELYCKSDRFERMPEFTVSSDSSNSLRLTGSTNHNGLRTDNLLHRRERDTDIECRDELLMVDGSNHTEHKCKCIRKLQCKSDQFQRMPQFTFSRDTCNGQFLTSGTNHISLRSDDLLRGRKRYADIGPWHELSMVDGSDDTKHKCNDIRELHSTGDQFERMPEPAVRCNAGNGQRIAGNTNHYTLGGDNLLHRRQRDTDIECRDELFMVNGSNLAEHKCLNIGELYSKSN